MANVNRFIRLIAIPALLVAYAAYLVVDYQRPENADREPVYKAKLAGLAAAGDSVEGLILGGSNAFYGLSARMLSERDGYQWYNFTVLSEGYGQASHQHAIEAAFNSEAARLRIRTVVYSSIMLLHRSTIAQFRNNTDESILTGETGPVLELKPVKALYRFGRAAFRDRDADSERVPGLLPDRFGDLDFETARCVTNNGPSITRLEDADIALDYYDSVAGFLHRLFPNAEIFMVVPSEFLTEPGLYASWGETLKARWAARGARPYNLIVQPSTPGPSFLCRMSHHPNALGRVWRTEDLIGQMAQLEK